MTSVSSLMRNECMKVHTSDCARQGEISTGCPRGDRGTDGLFLRLHISQARWILRFFAFWTPSPSL